VRVVSARRWPIIISLLLYIITTITIIISLLGGRAGGASSVIKRRGVAIELHGRRVVYAGDAERAIVTHATTSFMLQPSGDLQSWQAVTEWAARCFPGDQPPQNRSST